MSRKKLRIRTAFRPAKAAPGVWPASMAPGAEPVYGPAREVQVGGRTLTTRPRVDSIQLASGLQVPATTRFLGGDLPLSPPSAGGGGVAAVAEPECATYEVHCPRCRQLWYRLLDVKVADQGGAVCGTCRGVLSLRRHVTSTQGLNSGFDIESRRKRTDEYRG